MSEEFFWTNMKFRTLKCGSIVGRGTSSGFPETIIVIRRKMIQCYEELCAKTNARNARNKGKKS